MENASKALIIAGAILITLIIIGLGVAILSSTDGATDTTQFDAMQVSTFNNQFKPYEGTIQGSKLDALLDVLLANARAKKGEIAERPNITGWQTVAAGQKNMKNTEDKTTDEVYIDYVKALKEVVQTSKRYDVKLETDDSTDLVHTIKITETK